jgi:hypothetical protein
MEHKEFIHIEKHIEFAKKKYNINDTVHVRSMYIFLLQFKTLRIYFYIFIKGVLMFT